MADVTKYFPQESPIVTAIYVAYKQRGDAESNRGYLGASVIGHSCERYLWYTFRVCCKEDFPGRIYRLFETGDLEEIRMVKDLRDIGCTVHETDEHGNQFAVYALGGHFSGHMDGVALGIPGAEKTWHVLEFKTHNAKSFAKLKKDGVQASKPQHYAQMQAYMHETGMKRALYLACNKNTDELYAERVHYDKNFALNLMTKAERIITATAVPERITTRQDWWECKFCSAHSLCWGIGETALPVPSINCRQCCHAGPKLDGQARWVCDKHQRSLSKRDQVKCCDDHLVLPGLLSFAGPTDYKKEPNGNEYIEFTNNVDGQKWRHGNSAGCFGTNELRTIPASALTNQAITTAKDLFGAKTIDFHPDGILPRYPAEDSRIIWEGNASKLADAWLDTYNEDIIQLTPASKCEGFNYKAVEFTADGRGRVAIIWTKTRKAEIREGIE